MMRPAGVKMAKQDTQVERADQDKINLFSKLNMKSHDIQDDLKKLREELESFGDAVTAIEETLGEDGALKLFMGESMVSVGEDAATAYVEQVKAEKTAEVEEKQAALMKMVTQMQELKTQLYAKFGDSINLEEKMVQKDF